MNNNTKIYSPNSHAPTREPWEGTLAEVIHYANEDFPLTVNEIEARITKEVHGFTDEEYDDYTGDLEYLEDHLDKITLEDIRDLLDDPSATVENA